MTVTDRVTIDIEDLPADEVSADADTDVDTAGVADSEPATAAAEQTAEQTAEVPPAPAEPVAPEPVSPSTGLDDRLTAVDARLTELAERLGATGAAVDAVRTQAETSTEAGSVLTGRLTGAEGRLDSVGSAVQVSQQQINDVVDRLTTVGSRLDSLDDQLAAVKLQQADHARALTEVSRSIAIAVEQHTTDALVDTRHNLQLAVNSIAQLSLAMAESARDLTEDISAESANALLDSFRVDLDAILDQLGYTALGTTAGAMFDPHRHRALKRVATPDPAQDKVITKVIRDGYLSADTGRILLFADVEVSRHRP